MREKLYRSPLDPTPPLSEYEVPPRGGCVPALCAGQALGPFDAYPLYAGPGEELVTGRVATGVPHIEEQAARVPAADVAREVVANTGRDQDEAPPAEEPSDLWCPFAQAPLSLLRAPAFQRASSHLSRFAQGSRLPHRRQEIRYLAPVLEATNIRSACDELAVPGLDPGSCPQPGVGGTLEYLRPVVYEAEGAEFPQDG